MSIYRDQLENWLKLISVKANAVLDVGGLAKPVKDRVHSWEVDKYEILDNCAETQNKKPDFFYDLNNLVDLDKKYDVVFCLEVMEYIYNPIQALENINSFLRENGTLYMSFPAIYPVHNPQEIDYLRYTKEAIIKLLSETGFSEWEITPRVATEGANHLLNFYSLEGMHPVKNRTILDIGYMVKAKKVVSSR